MDRRGFLQVVRTAGIAAVVLPVVSACGGDDAPSASGTTSAPPTTGGAGPSTTPAPASFAGYGPLGEPDANGLRLPEGFTSRVVATTGETVEGTDYVWHVAPDGGAVFPQPDSGWIYVSNSEFVPGGVGMVRFDQDGKIIDAQELLTGSVLNCGGGATPWGTWLSGEEIDGGLIYEVDPTGAVEPEMRRAMGVFKHEATAADGAVQAIYLTEDMPEGALYRFRPTTWGDLSAGTLDVLTKPAGSPEEGAGTWVPVPDPSALAGPVRDQVPDTWRFDGGEGIDVFDSVVYFSTKGDNRLWKLEPDGADGATVTIEWDSATAPADAPATVNEVDNVVVGPNELPFIAEDGAGMHVVVVAADGTMYPVVQVADTEGSEVTGPAFTPDGTRLYFSSQRDPGRTYEVTGPFA